MSEIVFQIDIPFDDDGFVTLQCSFCNSRFKLTTADFQRGVVKSGWSVRIVDVYKN
jgi:hypothetical protein